MGFKLSKSFGWTLARRSNPGGGVRPPYPAPPGYRWQYLTENGARLAENGQPLITLERVS